MATINRQRGRLDILYWANSEPQVKGDPTDAAYQYVGLLQDLGDEFQNDSDTTVDRDTGTHEDAVLTTQSSGFDITCNVQHKKADGTVTEDQGQIDMRDDCRDQAKGWWLIVPQTKADDDTTAISGLEKAYGTGLVESFNYTRNQGDFKQFEASVINNAAPTYEPVP